MNLHLDYFLFSSVEAKMDKFTLLGTQQEDFIPRMITSQTETAQQVLSLIDVLFETNPLDQSCDARVRVNARPLQIIYDAVSRILCVAVLVLFHHKGKAKNSIHHEILYLRQIPWISHVMLELG